MKRRRSDDLATHRFNLPGHCISRRRGYSPGDRLVEGREMTTQITEREYEEWATNIMFDCGLQKYMLGELWWTMRAHILTALKFAYGRGREEASHE